MRALLLVTLLWPLSAAAQGARFDDPRVQEQLEALKLEPSIQQAQAAALAFFNIDSDTVSSMRSRAAVKALLPSVDVKVRQKTATSQVNTLDVANFSTDQFAVEQGVDGDAFEWEVGGSWSLSQLVFNSEVLDVSSVAVLQEGVLKEVTRLYYTRRRLQVDLVLSPPGDAATKLSKELRVEELTATLDAMTGNLFTKAAQRSARGERRRRR